MLFLPVEIKAREFRPKLHLAALATQFNIDSLIGREDVIDLVAKNSTDGIFFAKIAKPDLFKKLKSNRHKIIWLDEEAGLLYENAEVFFQERLPPDSVPMIDHFCFWSKSQLKVFCEMYPQLQNHATLTGHPRHDLPLIQRFEKNPSLSTSLTYFSNAHLTESQKIALIEDLNFLNQGNNKKFTISIRPHPFESMGGWEKLLREQQIELLDAQRPAYEDIARSDMIVHSGSTTAIDSAISGKISLKYVPEYLETNYLNDRTDLGEKLSLVVRSRDDLVSLVSDSYWIGDRHGKLQETLAEIGFKIDGKSTETIVKLIRSYAERTSNDAKFNFFQTAKRIVRSEPFEGMKTVLRNTQIAGKIGNWKMLHDQCSVIKMSEVEYGLSELEQDYKSKPIITRVCTNLFRLTGCAG